MERKSKEAALKDVKKFDVENIERKIFFIRGKKIMLDKDLAEFYCVKTGNLNKAVKRNLSPFPEDFMFQLTSKETESLRFQFGILKRGQHSKYLPYVFIEHGILMLSSVLNSERAIEVNIQIMRIFNKIRRMISSYEGLKHKMEELEKKFSEHDHNFFVVFEAIRRLLEEPDNPKGKIGFHGG